MKKYLFPANTNQYKANMHCHTTCSDGKLTPEEIKKLYSKKGYSIVAFTDHEAFFTHNDLTDENFVALNASELSLDGPKDEYGHWKVIHLNVISKDKNNQKATCFHPNYLWWFSDEIVDDFVKNKKYFGEFYNRVYTSEGVNDIIETAHKDGFLVTFNHIGWSGESLCFVSQLNNLDGFEISNYRSYIEGDELYNSALYRDLLRLGKRPLPIAGDDNHNFDKITKEINTEDSGGAFTYILAPNLSYESVIFALENGNAYSSMGPQIKALYLEGGYYHIETSPVREIYLRSYGRHSERAKNKDGSPITHAKFEYNENDVFVHFSAIDFEGYTAETRAYDLKEFE